MLKPFLSCFFQHFSVIRMRNTYEFLSSFSKVLISQFNYEKGPSALHSVLLYRQRTIDF